MREFVTDHRTVLQVVAMGMGAFSIIFGRQLLGHFTQLAPFYRLLLAAIPTALYYAVLASIMDTVSEHFFSRLAGQALELHLSPLAFAVGLAALYVAGSALTLRNGLTKERAAEGGSIPRSWSGRGFYLVWRWAGTVLGIGFANYYVFSVQRWFGGHLLPLLVVLAIALAYAVLQMAVLLLPTEVDIRLASMFLRSAQSKADGARGWMPLAVGLTFAEVLLELVLLGLTIVATVIIAHQVGWAFAVFWIGLFIGELGYDAIQDATKDLKVGTLSWIFGVPGALAALLGIVLTNVNVLPQ